MLRFRCKAMLTQWHINWFLLPACTHPEQKYYKTTSNSLSLQRFAPPGGLSGLRHHAVLLGGEMRGAGLGQHAARVCVVGGWGAGCWCGAMVRGGSILLSRFEFLPWKKSTLDKSQHWQHRAHSHSQLKTAEWKHTAAAGRTCKSIKSQKWREISQRSC